MGIGQCVIPTHADHRMLIILFKSRISPVLISSLLPCFTIPGITTPRFLRFRSIACIFYKTLELPYRDFRLANSKILFDLDTVLMLVIITAFLIFR